MTEEFHYVRTGWSMGSALLHIQVHVDSEYAEEFTESQWEELSVEVDRHMQAIFDFLSREIWADRQVMMR